MQFELVAVDEFGRVDVYADYGDGELVKKSIYTYKQDDVVYISDVSKDRAWYSCMEELYNKGFLTKEEWNDLYSELSQTFIKEDLSVANTSIEMTAKSSTTTVKGRFQWELADGTLLPLRQTKVELRDKESIDSRSIATTYTDNSGNFTFTFDNPDEWYDFESGGLDVFIRCYSVTKTFEVKQDLVFTYNYFDTPVKENVSTGSTTTFNYYITYDTSNNANKSYYVLQGMVVGQRFATAMGMSTDNFIHVIYPSGDGSVFPSDSAFCWGEIDDNCYSIIGTDNFDNFDTLIHEYGHFVECSMGNYGASLWEILINKPIHSANDDHFDDKPQKEYAMELTWSEAWATAFSQIAQQYYSTDYNGVPGFADITDGKNYETFTYDNNSSEAQEDAVIAFLWDLYDSGTNESYDNLALGYKTWWNYTTQRGTYTLQDFANVIENYYPTKRGLVGELMGEHQISPGNLMITNKSSVSSSTTPELSWKVNGSISNPNNQFQVVFYDQYGNYICSSPLITSTQANSSNFTYVVSQTVWSQVLKNYGGTFTIYIAVRGYHADKPISGPYLSKYVSVTLSVNKNLNIAASNRYTESQVKLDKGGFCDYTIKFASRGNRLIQTFGTKDTVLELYSSNGTLLLGGSETDDKGYSTNAMLSYNFSANTEYKLRVKFYATSVYGTTKIVILPTYSYATYQDIYNLTDYTMGLTWNLEQNNVRVMTYQYSTTQNLTMRVTSEVDTYLYIIDPRSTELIQPASSSTVGADNLYNDDYGGTRNSMITKTFVKNVPYLVIVSAYSPAASTSVGEFYVDFG